MMNKNDLINILKEQHAPMNEAVANKLKYLQSDDVFTDFDEEYAAENDDFAAAFDMAGVDETVENSPDIVATFGDVVNLSSPNLNNSLSNKDEGTQQTQKSQQSIVARIAALRGISFPGDKLPRKY